jgi:adenylate cyclase
VLILTLVDAGLPRVHYLREGDTLIGRSATCDLVIASPQLSRQHARVRVAGTRVTVQDLGSTYGTFVDSARLTGERELRLGESFSVAEITITLGGDLTRVDLQEEGHLLVDEGKSIVMSVVPGATPPGAAGAPSSERRLGNDRRRHDIGRPAGDRRSQRDRRGGRIIRLLTEIGRSLVQVQPLEQVLDRVVQLVFDVVPADRTCVVLSVANDQPQT